MAKPICLRLLAHWMRAAASRACCTAGSKRPIRIEMMVITTSNSISVKAGRDMAFSHRGDAVREQDRTVADGPDHLPLPGPSGPPGLSGRPDRTGGGPGG